MTVIRGGRALVTGGNGGIGRAICRALRANGADVIVTGRRADVTEAVAREVEGRAVIADLSRRSDVARLVEDAGDIDIVIANAGVIAVGDFEGWTQTEINSVLEVNLASPIALTRAFLPAFRQRGSGHFVYISSLSGKVGSPGSALYSATKFGLRGFASGLRCDLHRSGVGCSIVFPGFVRDAGLFAEAGVKLVPGVGTVTAAQVGRAVVKAIRSNRAEVDVAPVPLRLGTLAAGLFPGTSVAVQARLGTRISNQLAEVYQNKRQYHPSG